VSGLFSDEVKAWTFWNSFLLWQTQFVFVETHKFKSLSLSEPICIQSKSKFEFVDPISISVEFNGTRKKKEDLLGWRVI
jgi:hypothetical protein